MYGKVEITSFCIKVKRDGRDGKRVKGEEGEQVVEW